MTRSLSAKPDPPLTTLLEAFGTNLEFARDMAPLTSFKTGGKARYFLAVQTPEEVVRAIKAAHRMNLPFFVMGGGSNLLVSDAGYDGLVIKVNIAGLERVGKTEIECGAGEQLMALVDFATAGGLAGMEFAAGIWGTVGGAVFGNAGAFGSDIGSVIAQVTFIDEQGELRQVDADYCRFDYRSSRFREECDVIASVRVGLTPGRAEDIQARVDKILTERAGKHPVEGRSAGCFFKNIPDPSQTHGKLPAGRLLDEIGAKALSVGDARVFDKHANIIVNSGNATSKDIRQLADILKKKVRDRFGIELEEEVRQLGEF